MNLALPETGIIRDETGAQTLIGYVVDIRDGTARCHLDVGPQHGNRHGGLHGGIISCLLDNAMGFAATLFDDPAGQTRFLTISMTTQYVAPVQDGRVTARGTVTGGGQSTVFVEGRLVDQKDTLLATATGVYKKVRI